MRRRLDLPNRLHERVLHRDADITARISLAELGQGPDIARFQIARRAADAEFEQLHASAQVRQRDMDASLESPSDRGVQLPRDVGGAQDQHALGVVAHAVHLHEQLRLDPSRRFRLPFAARPAERVYLVDEDDRGLVLARHAEELLH